MLLALLKLFAKDEKIISGINAVVKTTIAILNPSALKARVIFGKFIQGIEKLMLPPLERIETKYKDNPKVAKLNNKATFEANLSPEK
jgi:hypothetical protein